MTGVYIHIPFCDHICFYCDFPKVLKHGQPVNDYLRCLLMEIKKELSLNSAQKIETIYIGGGTPSSLSPEQLIYFLKGLNQIFDIDKLKEFAMETNPNDLQDLEKLKIMYEFGIRRLSIGAQSFNDATLKRIGRTHSRGSIIQAVQNAQKVGFSNISLDLMFRLPGQTYQEFQSNLSQALQLGVQHLSIYSLILEQHTVFHNLLLEHRLKLPNPEQDRQMYKYALEVLTQNGWHQYEISNFSIQGFESKHNKLYWQNDDYYGFGAGAHSYLKGVRIQNKQVVSAYIEDVLNDELPILKKNRLSKQEKIEDEIFLGLRMNKGINLEKSSLKFKIDLFEVYREVIRKLLNDDLIEYKDNRIILTSNGRYIANDVFSSFLLSKSALESLTS